MVHELGHFLYTSVRLSNSGDFNLQQNQLQIFLFLYQEFLFNFNINISLSHSIWKAAGEKLQSDTLKKKNSTIQT